MAEALDEALLAEAAERFRAVRERIEAACARSGRDPSEVEIIGASKRQPLEHIAASVCAGLEWLGENYVQEARDKQGPLAALLERAQPGGRRPRWRLIGNLQRNKARHAVELFEAIDTLDRVALAEAIDRRAAALERKEPIALCVQVNLSREPQKSGVDEAELPGLLEACAPLEHVRVAGLMTVPAAADSAEASRPTFARLRELRDTLSGLPGGEHLSALSMGMSADFEVAVEEGATLVRIGTALFGARER